MANPGNGSNDSEKNPFVAFRRFIDDEVASMFAAFGTLRPHFEKTWEEIEKDHHAAWKHFSDSYERTTNPERTRIQPRTGEEQDQQQATPESEERQLACPFKREPRQATLFSTTLFDDASPYSPSTLESQEPTRQRGSLWTLAFLDLLQQQNHEPRHQHVSRDRSTDNTESWIDCMQRRVLPESQVLEESQSSETKAPLEAPSRKQSRTKSREESSASNEEVTELQLYDHFLNKHGRGHQAQEKSPISVISTLTTTERRTLPDGTTTTRTVMKKHFADGTEQSEEKTDVTHARPTVDSTPQSLAKHTANQEKPRSSWFWSSS